MKLIKYLILIPILLLAYNLRFTNYDKVPFPGQSQDEYSFSWVGMSLLQFGYPVGYSNITGYSHNISSYINVDRIFNSIGTGGGQPTTISRPWFDHPPTLGLITGGFAYLKGARVMEDAGVFLIRKPMLIIGTITVLAVFLLANQLFGFLPAIFASLVYATSPLIIVSSRMVQAENGMILFYILSLLFILYYCDNRKISYLWISGLLAGVTILFKVVGISAWLSGIIILFSSDNDRKLLLKEIVIFTVVTISIASIFPIYGMIYDPTTFVKILFTNSNRTYGVGSQAWYSLLTQVKITAGKFLTDGWPLAGWISIFVISLFTKSNKKFIYIVIPCFVYLIVYLFLGGEPYGWHHVPFFPFLIIAVAGTYRYINENVEYFGLLLLILLIPIGINISKVVKNADFNNISMLWRLVIICLALLSLMCTTKLNQLSMVKKTARVLIFEICCFAIYLTVRYSAIIDFGYWFGAN